MASREDALREAMRLIDAGWSTDDILARVNGAPEEPPSWRERMAGSNIGQAIIGAAHRFGDPLIEAGQGVYDASVSLGRGIADRMAHPVQTARELPGQVADFERQRASQAAQSYLRIPEGALSMYGMGESAPAQWLGEKRQQIEGLAGPPEGMAGAVGGFAGMVAPLGVGAGPGLNTAPGIGLDMMANAGMAASNPDWSTASLARDFAPEDSGLQRAGEYVSERPALRGPLEAGISAGFGNLPMLARGARRVGESLAAPLRNETGATIALARREANILPNVPVGEQLRMRNRLGAPLGPELRNFDPWDAHTAVNRIDPSLSQPEKLRQLQMLTTENKPYLDELANRIGERVPGTHSVTNIKDPDGVIQKTNRPELLRDKPWHDVEHVRDALRFRTEVESMDQLGEVLQTMRDEGFQIVKLDTRKMLTPKGGGWRMVATDLRMPNGQIVEHYATFPELIAEQDVGHKLYEKWRGVDMTKLTEEQLAQHAADDAEMVRRYTDGFNAALERQGLTFSEFEDQVSRLEGDWLGVTDPAEASLHNREASFSGSRSQSRSSSPYTAGASGPATHSREPAARYQAGEDRITTVPSSERYAIGGLSGMSESSLAGPGTRVAAHTAVGAIGGAAGGAAASQEGGMSPWQGALIGAGAALGMDALAHGLAREAPLAEQRLRAIQARRALEGPSTGSLREAVVGMRDALDLSQFFDELGTVILPAKASKLDVDLGARWADVTGRPLADWNQMSKLEREVQIRQLARVERDVMMGGPGTLLGDPHVMTQQDLLANRNAVDDESLAGALRASLAQGNRGVVLPEVATALAKMGVRGAGGAALGAYLSDEDHKIVGATVGGLLGIGMGYALAGQGDNLKRLMSWRKAGLLSSPSTTVMNVTSTATSVAGETLKDAPAAAWDRIIAGLTGIRAKDGLSMSTLRASWDAVGEATRQAADIMRVGEDAADMAKWDRMRVTFDNPVVQRMHDAVYNLLGGQDRFFHVLAEARSLQEQANVIAKAAFGEGAELLGQADVFAQPGNFRDWRELASYLQQNPTMDMAMRAQADAALAVFRNQDGGLAKIAKGIRTAMEEIGPDAEAVFDLFLPFTTTPANVVSRVVEYSPLGFLGAARDVQELRGMVNEGAELLDVFNQQRKVSDRLGRATLGTGVIALGAWLAANDYLSPGYPRSSRERNVQRITERGPGSIRIGNKDYAIERLAPFGPLLVMGAEAYQGAQRGGVAGAVGESARYIGQNVSNESFLGDIDGMLSLVNPQGSLGSAVAGQVSDAASSFVPNIVRRGLAGYDETVREVERPSLERPESLISRAKTAVPGVRQDMPPRVDPLGRQVTRGPGGLAGAALSLFNPFTASVDLSEDDPLRGAIEETGASITSPQARIENLGVERGTQEFAVLSTIYGRAARQAMDQAMQQGGTLTIAGKRTYVSWADATTEQRRDLLERAANSVRTQLSEELRATGLYPHPPQGVTVQP